MVAIQCMKFSKVYTMLAGRHDPLPVTMDSVHPALMSSCLPTSPILIEKQPSFLGQKNKIK